jgi:hypothetical protein
MDQYLPKKNYKNLQYIHQNLDFFHLSLTSVIGIKPLLPFIISDTQKGFIKGRFIGENTRLLYDLMHYLEQHNKPVFYFLNFLTCDHYL